MTEIQEGAVYIDSTCLFAELFPSPYTVKEYNLADNISEAINKLEEEGQKANRIVFVQKQPILLFGLPVSFEGD